jgi:hypothetical protein
MAGIPYYRIFGPFESNGELKMTEKGNMTLES